MRFKSSASTPSNHQLFAAVVEDTIEYYSDRLMEEGTIIDKRPPTDEKICDGR